MKKAKFKVGDITTTKYYGTNKRISLILAYDTKYKHYPYFISDNFYKTYTFFTEDASWAIDYPPFLEDNCIICF